MKPVARLHQVAVQTEGADGGLRGGARVSRHRIRVRDRNASRCACLFQLEQAAEILSNGHMFDRAVTHDGIDVKKFKWLGLALGAI